MKAKNILCKCGHEYDDHQRLFNHKTQQFDFSNAGPCTQCKRCKRFRRRPEYKCCRKTFKKRKEYLAHRIRYHAKEVKANRVSSQRNNYGQTPEEFDDQLKKQRNRCAACGDKFASKPHQDHFHLIERLKIEVLKTGRKFRAYNKEYGLVYYSRNRKRAIRMVRLKLKRLSRRGLLCWPCNVGLRKWLDNPKRLRRAAKYLEYWQKKQGWDFAKKERIQHHGSH